MKLRNSTRPDHDAPRFCSLRASCFVPPIQKTQPFKFPLKFDSVRFAVIGDMGTGEMPAVRGGGATCWRRGRRFPFEFVITMGDNIYGGNRARDFENKFEKPYKALLDSGVKFYASLGNHDGPAERAYKYFNMNGANYYAFSKGQRAIFRARQ